MNKWKVTYEDIQAKAGQRPFWRNRTVVDAVCRKSAVEQVSSMFPPPKYGNYRASKINGNN